MDKILTKSESSGLEWAVALRKILTLLDEEEDVELNVAKIMPVQETRSESVTQTTQVGRVDSTGGFEDNKEHHVVYSVDD